MSPYDYVERKEDAETEPDLIINTPKGYNWDSGGIEVYLGISYRDNIVSYLSYYFISGADQSVLAFEQLEKGCRMM